MGKRIGAVVVSGLFGAAFLATPAHASDSHCGVHSVPDGIMCPVKCNVNYVAGLPSQLPNVPPNECQMG